MSIGFLAAHWLCAGFVLSLSVAVFRLRLQVRLQRVERGRERRMREELEAYARLDLAPAHAKDSAESERGLARRVCCTVAEKSVFTRVAMLLRNAEGRFAAVGSVGTDDLTLSALHRWSESFLTEGTPGTPLLPGQRSFAISLGEWGQFDEEVGSWALGGRRERRRSRRAVVTPLRARTGRMLGAIVVCADGTGIDGPDGWTAGLERAMGPIEALAARLAAMLENEALSERVLRAEKLAGLGQLAGGVAHALNNPLTAVLGFAELIAETAAEPRVCKDAQTILLEALKMKQTVGRLVEFWRPASRTNETVDLLAMLHELKGGCEEKLRARGVALELAGVEQAPAVRGSRAQLRQVMEHLLNNAAQAIATAPPRAEGEPAHAIRLTLSYDERAVHLIVSDTGPGFQDPGRVFDPFYTTRGPEQGAGLGLSICYGVVREHAGEISAFNLHPHGAAVVVELPVRRLMQEEVIVDDGVYPLPPQSIQSIQNR